MRKLILALCLVVTPAIAQAQITTNGKGIGYFHDSGNGTVLYSERDGKLLAEIDPLLLKQAAYGVCFYVPQSNATSTLADIFALAINSKERPAKKQIILHVVRIYTGYNQPQCSTIWFTYIEVDQ